MLSDCRDNCGIEPGEIRYHNGFAGTCADAGIYRETLQTLIFPGGFMPIAVGQAAPEFTLKDQNQKDVKLSDLVGKRNIVLIFYPLDFSPICTNEHACFVNEMKQFEKLDAQLLGLSVDSVWTHKAFADTMGISYPLLADFHPKGAVADKFGMYFPEKGITGRAIA